jgi:hypothetical protein
MARRVEFLICGTQKGGTTALADYLRQHPRLFIPEEKELHFFDDETGNWCRPDIRNYHRSFRTSGENQIWGEATPVYMYWEPSIKRIWQYNQQMKMVVMLRNPISRAYSHWAMEKARGCEASSFEEALSLEEERCQAVLPLQHRVYSYVDRGFYTSQLRRLWRFFGKESVLILRQEELQSAPRKVLDQICSHLGVAPMPRVDVVKSNANRYLEPMSANCREKLRKVFWHEICQLETLLGWDCSEWLKP